MATVYTQDLSNVAGKSADDVLQGLIGVAIAFIVLDTLFVSLRFIARVFIQRVRLDIDDFLIIPAYVFNVALCAIGIVMAKHEMIGNPPADQPIADLSVLVVGAKCIYALLPFLYFGAVWPKLSLLTLYVRIFMSRPVRIASFITMGLVAAAGTAFTLTALFGCTPVEYFWNRTIPGGHCIKVDLFYRINTPINIVIDLIILVIPMPALWKLQAPKTKKLGLMVVFGLGGIGMLACLGRWIVVLKYTSEVLIPYTTKVIVGWCIIEPAIYLIAACLPPCSSYFTLLSSNSRIRRMVNMASTGPTSQGAGSRKSGLILSSKPHSGFGRLADESNLESERSPRSPTSKHPSLIRSERCSDDDMQMNDLSIDVRTEITVEESQNKDKKELTLSELLQQGH